MTDPVETAVRDFFRAACNGDLEAAERIRAANPALTVQSLHAASIYGDERGLDAGLSGDLSAVIGRGFPPLFLLSHSHYASPAGGRAAHLAQAARRLTEAGADPSFAFPDPDLPGGARTVLTGAAGDPGSLEVCSVLLDAGADPGDVVSLAMAVGSARHDCAALLVERGAEVNAITADGRATALHWILDVRYSDGAVTWLLAHGADPNLTCGELRETALHVAVRRRRLEPIDALAAAGAELDARTRGGVTAYQHALRRQFTEVVQKLAALGADTTITAGDELAVALQSGALDRARELLEREPALARSTTPEDSRLLADLTGYGKLDAMRLLLDAGADVASRGLDDGTALHQAAWFGQPAAARLLIDRGAPLDVRGDAHDCTPLGWVTHGSRYSGGAASRKEVYAELAEMLLAAGAPLPEEGQRHDREQHAGATAEVKAVLARYGWEQGP
jgi:ankyrin repeat protein